MIVRLISVCMAALALSACGQGITNSLATTSAASSTTSPPSTSSKTSTTPSKLPTISGSAATTVGAGSAYSFTPATTDPSGGTLVFSIKNLPTWATFDSQTGQLSGTPTSNNVGYDANVQISVSDGTSSASLAAFGITVAAAGSSAPPVSSTAASCSAVSGGLQLSAKVVRQAGISPLLAFFDATATADSVAAKSVTQDVSFKWNFGDTGASGSGTWAYGANPSASSMNVGTGIVAAHLYRTAGSDTKYTATVTATDGTNTATCDIGVTAYDPSGANGFPDAATTCVSSSGTPVAGSGDCPVGAAVLKTSSIQSAFASGYGNGKRLLFKCGDTFSGDAGNDNITAVKWAIGAYGGCENTQTNRPIMSNNGQNFIFMFSNQNGNGTISDLDCEGNSSTNGGCLWGNDGSGIMYQDTMYNLYSNNEQISYAWNQCSQCGLVQVNQNNVVGPDTEIGTYVNISGFKNYPYSGNTFNNVAYQAIIGSHFDDGTANYQNNAETVRVFGCQDCYIANSDFLNAGPSYAQLKLHAGGLTASWVGAYTEYVEISDNYFAGNSGANAVEVAPENSQWDERLRYIVIERNVWWQSAATSGRQLEISGTNITARDNAFYLAADSSYGIQVCQRGIEPAPQNIEAYNNTFYGASGGWNSAGISVSSGSCGGATDPSNSYFQNNMGYFPNNQGGTVPVVSNGGGSGITISNNTSNTLASPGFTNASGTFKRISDWKPTANYTGGVSVPVYFDALGLSWLTAWDLGAVDP